jgi:predicted ATPase/class 3 adenylate cyclase
MSALPTGPVTFLLTDVVGSAKLWEEHPEAMRQALSRHDALAELLIRRHGGTLLKSRGEGDSLFAVFARAQEAVLAAAAVQQALLPGVGDGDVRLSLRLALHTGQADQRDGDYYGAAVNRCARLRGIAHGCQILLSGATASLVRDGLPQPLRLRDLGEHKLKDLVLPEHVFQLVHPELPSDFPPLRPRDADSAFTNLPQPLTSFVGREREIAQIQERLPHTPLLTLTGAGGCGKTRLALEVAAGMQEDYTEGVWLAELASLSDAARVPLAVAGVLRVREEPGRPILETLCAGLSGKSLLLILDNCEHLIAACAELAQALLRGCPGVRLLVTSREALGINGEAVMKVPSLSLPDLDVVSVPAQMAQSEAVRLFVSRASAAEPPFTVTPRNAPAVAQICYRLDGIPLALELAAARVKVLSVEQIAQRLDDSFRLLTGGSRTALPRQQTLRALIDWSYDLLSGPESALLRCLSVFTGGWTLEAAEQVCAGEGVPAIDVLDLLGRLVDKSLVVVDEAGGTGRRYHLLQTVRQYSRDRLKERGEDEDVRSRHRDWFLALAEDAGPGRHGRDQRAWLDGLETEHDNFRAALDGCVLDGCGEACQRLAGALWHFWYVRGHLVEGGERLARALAMDDAPTAGRARALCGANCLALSRGDDDAARSLAEEGLAISQERNDDGAVAEALKHLGMVARHRGDYGTGRALFENSLALYRELDCPQDIAHLLCCLGELAWLQGDLRRARAVQEESLRLSQEIGGGRDRGYALTNLGNVLLAEGRPDAALPLIEEGLAIFRSLSEKWAVAYGLWSLGNAALGMGQPSEAASLFREALSLVRGLDSRWSIGFGLEALGLLAATQGQEARAVRLLSAGHALREYLHCPLPPVLRAAHAACLTAARGQMGPDTYHAAWDSGQSLTLTQAMDEAMEERSLVLA